MNPVRYKDHFHTTYESIPLSRKILTTVRSPTMFKNIHVQSMPNIIDKMKQSTISLMKHAHLTDNAIRSSHFISPKKKNWTLKDIMPPFQETESPPNEDVTNSHRGKVRANHIQFHSENSKGIIFLKPDDIITSDGQQHRKRRGMVDSMYLDQFQKKQYADAILDEPRIYKLHKIPSRCLKRPNYSESYQKKLNKFDDLRVQSFIRDIDMQLGKAPQTPPQKKNKAKKLLDLITTQPIEIKTLPAAQVTEIIIRTEKTQAQQTQIEVDTYGRQVDKQALSLFGFKAIRTLLNENNKLPQKRLKMEHMKRVRLALLQLLHHLEKLKICPNELLNGKIFPSKPFEHPLARKYFQACKSDNLETITSVLNIHKYLVYEFDLLMMTALHWACKRGHVNVAHKILYYGADPDAQDIVGRTPLYLSIDNGYDDITKLLLLHRANPWNLDNCKYDELFPNNANAKQIIQNARKISILLRMTPPHQRNAIWQKEQLAFYVNPHSD